MRAHSSLHLLLFLLLLPPIVARGDDNSLAPCGAFGWTPFDGNCFKLFTASHLNFEKANKLCRGAGASMASIRSAEENSFVFRMVEPELRVGQQLCKLGTGGDGGAQKLMKSFWIGYKRVKEERDNGGDEMYRCSWTDGSTMTPWADAPHSAPKPTDSTEPRGPWAPGQPSGTVDWQKGSQPEQCVHLLLANPQLVGSRAMDGQWNDVGCEAELCGVICKMRARTN